MFSQSYIFNVYWFLSLCVLCFVVVVVVVIPFFTGCIQEARQGRALVYFSVIPSPFCDALKSCDINSAESDIWYLRSKRGTVQP